MTEQPGENIPDLRHTFDKSAASYQSARPDYPQQLFEDLITATGVDTESRLLEIGPGPGKATVPLAERGFSITGLELGADLAEQARRNLADHAAVTVINSSFEDWSPQQSSFDLIFAANAWHWLDPTVKWAKAFELLAPTGHLATFAANHAFPADADPFFHRIQQAYDEIGEGVDGPWPPPPPEQLPDPTPDFERSGHFVVDTVRTYVWEQQYDADAYIALLNTFSGHIAMSDQQREHLFGRVRELLSERPDGQLTRHWVSRLVVAHPRG